MQPYILLPFQCDLKEDACLNVHIYALADKAHYYCILFEPTLKVEILSMLSSRYQAFFINHPAQNVKISPNGDDGKYVSVNFQIILS